MSAVHFNHVPLLISKTASYRLIMVLFNSNVQLICLYGCSFLLMDMFEARELRWWLMTGSHDGALVFVIAFCHLQRVLRILVRSQGENLRVTIIVEQITR